MTVINLPHNESLKLGRPVRILLVDDSRDFLASAADFLSGHAHLSVVGRCIDAAEAMRALKFLRPDLVLVDYVMPGINGLELARSIKKIFTSTRIVMVSLLDGVAYRDAAYSAGLDGYVYKAEFANLVPPLIDSLFERVQLPPPSARAIMVEQLRPISA